MHRYPIIRSSPYKPLIGSAVSVGALSLIYIFSLFDSGPKIVIILIALTVGLVFAGLASLYTCEFVLEKEKIELIDKSQGIEKKKKVIEKKDILGISVKAYMSLSKTMPRYLFLIRLTTSQGIIKFNMYSYSDVKKMIEEWNVFGYPNYTLTPGKEMKKFLWVRPFLYSLLLLSPVFFAVLWGRF